MAASLRRNEVNEDEETEDAGVDDGDEAEEDEATGVPIFLRSIE